jgi:uncharacterized surface anchored protein
MKHIMIFLSMTVMMIAAKVTVYADYPNGQPCEPPVYDPPFGSLVITNSTHDGHLLQGAVFAVYRLGENVRLAELVTNSSGRTQELPLPQGNYQIIVVTPAHGYIAVVDRHHTTIIANERNELTIFSTPIHAELTPTVEYGRLLITNREHSTGTLLDGAVFEVRRAMDNGVAATVTTDFFGEAAVDLPIGDYFVRKLEPAQGFMPNPDRINARISANCITEINVQSRPLPDTTPQPVENGRVLITIKAHGTGDLLKDAVFEIRNMMDNEVVATLTTDGFGEASVTLPVGEYFMREIQPPRGFTPNLDRINVKIAADRITEANLTSRPIPEPTPTPTPPPTQQEASPEAPPEPGRMIITSRAEETGELLAGLAFEVSHAMDSRLVAELVTDRFGEAAVTLMAGDYHLRQVGGIEGYAFNTDRINVRITAGAINEVNVTNRTHVAGEPDPTPADTEEGRLIVTLTSSATGERLEAGTFIIHHSMTDEIAATIITNRFGEASVFLPPGEYFMRQASMPQGYVVGMDRYPFIIRSLEVTNIPIALQSAASSNPSSAPQAPRSVAATPRAANQSRQGSVDVIPRAEQSGNPIVGVAFGLYRVSDNTRITELTTDANGRVSVSLSPGEYYLRNYAVPYGFFQEQARIFFTVSGTNTVTVDVTMQRDWSIPYVDYGFITLPQTGELLPIQSYVLGAVFMALGLAFFVVLWQSDKNKRKGVKSYA